MNSKETLKGLSYLKRAIDKELRTLGSKTIPGLETVNDWMTKTWNSITKSDIEVDEVTQRRRNALRLAKKSSLTVLAQNLERNQFRGLILDLAQQVIEDQIIFDEPDALYAVELAIELSQMRGSMPMHSLLLNAIHQKSDEYGTLDNLRKTNHSMDLDRMEKLRTVNFFYSKEALPDSDVAGTVDDGPLKGLDAERLDGKRASFPAKVKTAIARPVASMSTDSELFQASGASFSADDDKSFIEQRSKNVRNSRQAVVSQWARIEERVRHRVETLRAESDEEAMKKELWDYQKGVEQLVYDTEKACADEADREFFKQTIIRTMPAFKSAMGRNISKRPEFARQVYDVLGKLTECDVAAHEYLEVAVALSNVQDSGTLLQISEDLTFGRLGENAAEHVFGLIQRAEEKAESDTATIDGSRLPVAFAAR